jgi:hypothetical protein
MLRRQQEVRMEPDRPAAIAALLRQAELEHAEHEAKDLGGVYDQDWPQWYATYAVEHGLDGILGHEVPVDRLTTFLADGYAEFASADPRPTEPWAEYTAARISAEL